jgi:hypothetical protein
MNRIEYKNLKEIKERKINDDYLFVGITFIEIYDENGEIFRTFDKNDSDKVEGFIIKAKKFAKGGRFRIKYY